MFIFTHTFQFVKFSCKQFEANTFVHNRYVQPNNINKASSFFIFNYK
ncbi:MAG: hypothetical protein WCG25_02835 [bacterium]